MRERVRRVHEVLLEASLARAASCLHHLAEALPLRSDQRDAAEPKVAQRLRDELRLDGLLRRPRRCVCKRA